jgi:hypothetical protein
MADFPRLKTEAVMQYPASREFRQTHRVLQFVDGSQQGYRECRGALRRWVIRLELLDEVELAAFQAFFVDCQGRFGSFAFVDPWDGTEYTDCRVDQDDFEFELLEEMRGKATLVIRQNRS